MDVRGCVCISSVTTIGKISWKSASCQDSGCLRPESGFGLRPFLENLQIFVCIYVYRGYRFTDDIYLRLPSLTMTTSSVRPELRTLSRSVFGRDEEFQ